MRQRLAAASLLGVPGVCPNFHQHVGQEKADRRIGNPEESVEPSQSIVEFAGFTRSNSVALSSSVAYHAGQCVILNSLVISIQPINMSFLKTETNDGLESSKV